MTDWVVVVNVSRYVLTRFTIVQAVNSHQAHLSTLVISQVFAAITKIVIFKICKNMYIQTQTNAPTH